MSISFTTSGSFQKTENFLRRILRGDIYSNVTRLAQEGTRALSQATPVDSGETAASWSEEVEISRGGCKVTWINTHNNGGVNIAIILQYGHGTGTGGYVAGRDYINPAIKPIFDKIADEVWKEVTRA